MEAKRKFNVPDAYVVEYAKDMRNLFTADIADFAALDPDFDAAFNAEWLVKINAAEAQLTDEIIVDVQTQYTNLVIAAMKNCQNYYQEVKFFVRKAFGDNQAIQNEFGADNYNNIRGNQPQLIEFMRDLYSVANKYAAQLDVVNFGAAKIARIKDLADALDTANQEQNNYVKGRPTLTAERIGIYNRLWDTLSLVSSAAKIIYRDNIAKYNQYLLPGSEENQEILSLLGKVTDAANGNPIVEAQITITGLGITALTDTNGKYGIGNLPAGSYELTCSAIGYNTVTLNSVPIVEDRSTRQDFTLETTTP
ncbi:MAG TPA: carboxypeptidase-like regulatory domain-containing protein [Chitinophagales bacterium]|nr:carboxypeptidase-like regulatory domain-containing protein [Chitinophagales bacterium]HRK27100.1 carboxypeptidase-like regulatory domain-containing protein [Chitinophagales bacterium]